MIVAICACAVQALVALLVVLSPQGASQAIGVVALAATLATFVGAVFGVVYGTPVGPLLVAAGQLVVAGLCAVKLVGAWDASRDLGVDGIGFAAVGVLMVGFATIALFALMSAPVPAAVLALAGAFAFAGLGAVVAGAAARATGADCDRFRFDPDRWLAGTWDDREQIEFSVVRCGSLVGWTRDQVRRLPATVPSADNWSSLTFRYDRTGRVAQVTSAQSD